MDFNKEKAVDQLFEITTKYDKVASPSQYFNMMMEVQKFVQTINDTAFEKGYLKGVEIKNELT